MLGGLQNRYRHGGEEKNFQLLPGIEPSRPTRSLVTVLAEVSVRLATNMKLKGKVVPVLQLSTTPRRRIRGVEV
jgi:hypothetical protein